MPSVSKSVEVPLSQDEAFALITDTARFGEWLTMHESWPGGEPGALAQDQQFVQKLKIMGMPSDVSWTVTEIEAPSKLVMRGAGPMGATLGTVMTASGGDGATTLSYEAEFSGAAIQGPMGDMVTKRAGEELEASLGKLKELAG